MSVTVGRVGGGALLRQRDRIPEGWSTPSSGSSGPVVEEAMDKLVGGRADVAGLAAYFT